MECLRLLSIGCDYGNLGSVGGELILLGSVGVELVLMFGSGGVELIFVVLV